MSEKEICSIVGCDRDGRRLIESLKSSHPLKKINSGRVCEAHYRQDLRSCRHEEKTLKKSSVKTEKIVNKKQYDDKLFKWFCRVVLANLDKL